MKTLEKKLRIQLYDGDMNQVSDRLVDQDRELYKGPLEPHTGPMRIEVSLFTKEDVPAFIEYLQKVQGELPLDRPKGPRGRPNKGSGKPDQRQGLIETLKSSKEILKTLKELGFVGITIPFLNDMGYKVKVPALVQSEEKWTHLVRLIKKAKNPLNHKYDPLVLISFNSDRMVISQDGEVTEKIKLGEGVTEKIKVPAKAKLKFPHYLTLDERNQFRVDMDKIRENPDEKPTRFYQRWVHEIAKINEGSEIVFPKIKEIPAP